MLRHRVFICVLAASQWTCAQSTAPASGASYYDLWTKAQAHLAKKEFEPAAAPLDRPSRHTAPPPAGSGLRRLLLRPLDQGPGASREERGRTGGGPARSPLPHQS